MKILLAVDKLGAKSESLRLVTKLLQDSHDTQLWVLHVSNEKISYYHKTPLGITESLSHSELSNTQEIEKAVFSLLYPWKERIHFYHVVGQPAAMICEIAENEAFDMIVIGKHGYRVSERLRWEGVSHRVMARAKVPVLIA